MARITLHRRHPGRYDVAVERPGDEPDREFEWPLDPPEGVTRAAYEASMAREAVLLVEAEQSQQGVGVKVKSEGTDIDPRK